MKNKSADIAANTKIQPNQQSLVRVSQRLARIRRRFRKKLPRIVLNRLLKASYLSGIDPEVVLMKYVSKSKEVYLPREFYEIYDELVDCYYRR